MALEQKLNYRFKAFQIETTEGFEWGVQFIDVPNIVGGGDTVEEAYYEALDNLHDYFDYLKEEGEEIPQPSKEPEFDDFSGKLVLRLSKSNHMKIKELAEQENISINSLLNEFITQGIERKICKQTVNELVKEMKQECAEDNNLSLKLAHKPI